MRVLVTGGAGFVGSHLCKKLLEGGNTVICLDNLSSCRVKKALMKQIPLNIESFKNTSRFKFIKHDTREPFPKKKIGKIDRIYHLACPASPPHYQKNKLMTVQTNVLGSIHALELAKEENARILLASTSEIYGDPLEHPQKETYRGNVSTLGPRACYDEGKRIAETLFHDYYIEKKVDVRIARIFNTYGPNMDVGDGRVISNFIVQALNNEKITIYGSGDQTRSFQYISDLIRGLELLMEANSGTKPYFPVNLGTVEEITIKKLAKEIIEMTNSKSKIVFVKQQQNDPSKRKPDISLAKERLKWTPSISLEDGLAKTIAFFKKELKRVQKTV